MISRLNVKTILVGLILIGLFIGLSYPLISFCTFTLSHSREDVITHMVGLLEKPHLYHQVEEIYTPEKHQLAQIISGIICFITLLIPLVVFLKKRWLLDRLDYCTNKSYSITRQFIRNSVPEHSSEKLFFGGLLSAWAVSSVYLIWTEPVTFDEADTWLLFVSKGPIFISSFYPFPNNHIFYNWCVWALHFLPLSPTLLLRIPLIPAGFLSLLLFYRYSKTLFNTNTALAGTLFFVFSNSFLEYNHLARGYLFTLMFGLLLLYALRKAESGFRKRYVYAIHIALILGTYTIPSFIYLSAPVLIFYLYRFYRINPSLSFQLFRISVIAAIMMILFYSPVLIASGNYNFFRQYNPVEWARVPEVLIKIQWNLFDFVFGYSVIKYAIAFLFVAALVKTSFSVSYRWLSMLALFVFLIPCLSFFVQRQVYPPRIFIHLIIFTSILIGYLIMNFRASVGSFTPFIVLMVMIPVYLFNSLTKNPKMDKYDRMNNAAITISEKMIEENRSTIFFKAAYLKPLIEYYTKNANHKVRLFNEQRLWEKDRFEPDSAYDVIVWTAADTIPPLLQPYNKFYQDSTVVVLFRKK